MDVVEGRTAKVDLVLRWGGSDVRSHAAEGEIGGRVFVRGTRKPLTSNEVRFSLYAVSPWKFVAMGFPRDDGQFRFRDVPPGSYRIIANPVRPNSRPAQVDVDLTRSGNKEGIEFALEECASGKVKFVVRDSAGKPIEGAHFSTVKDEGGGRSTSSTFAAESTEPGVYVAELETGSRKVHVSREGFEVEVRTVAVKENKTVEVKVVLRPKPEKR